MTGTEVLLVGVGVVAGYYLVAHWMMTRRAV